MSDKARYKRIARERKAKGFATGAGAVEFVFYAVASLVLASVTFVVLRKRP